MQLSEVRLLLVSGSLRSGSTNAGVLATAAATAPADVRVVAFDGLGALPHFDPDDDAEGATLHPAVAGLRAELGAAEGLLLCTPEYAGALPGALKKALEWSVGGGEADGMPVTWIDTASPASPTRAADAHASPRKALGYLGSEVLEAACARAPVERGEIGPDGLVADHRARAGIRASVDELAARGRQKREAA